MDDESAVEVHFFMQLGVEIKCGVTQWILPAQTTHCKMCKYYPEMANENHKL